MRECFEAELRVAQARGVVSPDEAEALLSKSRREGHHPLMLLVETGVISEDTFLEIQAVARADLTAPLDSPFPSSESTAIDETLIPGATAPRPGEALLPGSPTLTLNPTPAALETSSLEPAFPVPGWERYQPIRFLGQGGMGRVYLAHDPLLRRNVALKFVRGDDPDLVRRFGTEAQAQARVEHERVCKVYEVGEVRGQPFIAMQYVEGRSLLEVARELSLEQTVMVMKQVTEGVHAAHRAGLIHRDIKPSNILVERGEDGQWRPFVMDFGLARDWQREHTVTGTVLGTLHYMAPEQARGDIRLLDRRADVYGLGATLYVLLTGKMPIPGDNNLEVLTNLANQDPRPLRQWNKNVPADLEAIVLKCLERQPAHRYDSARALAEDLERFLNGEAVKARSVGSWYRLRKQARKHRALLAMAAVLVMIVGFALGQAMLARRELERRERQAHHFGERARDVHSRTRIMQLSRLHDTTAELKNLRQELAAIKQEMERGGTSALGPGHYALGLGWLELGEPDKARHHLEAAWKLGFQQSSVVSGLALAYGQLYNLRLREVNLDIEWLAHLRSLTAIEPTLKEDDLARTYREHAIHWLNLSEESRTLPREYIAALLAFYRGHSNEALARLDELKVPAPGFYEAAKLRGDIFFRRATTPSAPAAHNPEQTAQILADLTAAREQYIQVTDTAQSWPEAHFALARVDAELLFMSSPPGSDNQQERQEHGRKALEHLERAVRASPDHVPSLILTAMVQRNLAGFEQRADAQQAILRKAIQAGTAAVALAPSNTLARKELAMDLRELGASIQREGLDPRGPLNQALEVLEKIPAKDHDYYVHHTRALVFIVMADHADSTAMGLQYRDKSITDLNATLTLADRYSPALNNLADQHISRAAHPQNPNREKDLQLAGKALKQSLSLTPKNPSVIYREGDYHLVWAQHLRDKDEDGRPSLKASVEACRRGQAIAPRRASLFFIEGLAWMELARAAWELGEPPFPDLVHAQRAFEQARTVAPKNKLAHSNLANLHATRAEYLHRLGRDFLSSLHDARLAAREATKLSPTAFAPRNNLGNTSRLQAEHMLESQGTPGPHLPLALETLGHIRADEKGDEHTVLYLAQAQTLQARARTRQGGDADGDFEKAEQTYRAAVEMSTTPLDARRIHARHLLEWATWRRQTGRDARPLVDQGLALLDEVLRARPSWAEVRALHASLRLLRSDDPQTSARARQDLRDALKDNPNLRFEWEKRAHLSVSRVTD
ncbi:protein kinase [Myxococcus sp. K38C18041901]|uniref:serine/threonine-protein kinase n=1 Tax=Myxococcus guangdongensis TaxID=2906760 RepID=UPI0020A80ED2|nr:serine/threonine-protein kinase [Myxococcus guangdongensis]MCP3064818.1 protein kinase [Myxococcus guangdongensis]